VGSPASCPRRLAKQFEEETNLLHLPGSEPTYLSRSARQLVITPNTVSRLTVVILFLVLCEDKSMSLKSREQNMRIIANRMPERILAPEIQKVTGNWRKLHN
jgi:hypothetical protein